MQLDIYLNVAVGGILTGLVYGLMALGLSVIFGVVRVVNFAHGEMMTMAMYAAITLFAAFRLDHIWYCYGRWHQFGDTEVQHAI